MATGTETQRTTTGAPEPTIKESRGWLWSLLIGLLILGSVATIPLFGDAATMHTWTLIVMYIVLAQGWNFIGGFTGYSAFGNVAFFGIGAYATGLLLQERQSFLLGLLVSAVVAGLFALLIGLPVLRLKGHYFAIATLGTAEALRELTTVRDIGGGGGGLMSLPPPTGVDIDIISFYAFLGLSLLCLLVTTWLTRSRFGYALVAIRESEQAAEALGIPTYRYKVAAFMLSAVPTALAGGLYAYWTIAFDPPTVYSVSITVEMVLLCTLGSTGTILGPVLAAIVFELLSHELQISGFSQHNTLLGLSIALVALFLPQGILRFFQAFTRGSTVTEREAIRAASVTEGPRRVRYFTATRRAIRAFSFMEGVRRVRRFIAANGI
ncbi:MAG: branched-chain amino acid ABC transporter permease [Ktedonobacteraceae bacterium]|nr:branched-chain amino acid ABC transporter permease [Ktedonobacteraceae bacterium]